MQTKEGSICFQWCLTVATIPLGHLLCAWMEQSNNRRLYMLQSVHIQECCEVVKNSAGLPIINLEISGHTKYYKLYRQW